MAAQCIPCAHRPALLQSHQHNKLFISEMVIGSITFSEVICIDVQVGDTRILLQVSSPEIKLGMVNIVSQPLFSPQKT